MKDFVCLPVRVDAGAAVSLTKGEQVGEAPQKAVPGLAEHVLYMRENVVRKESSRYPPSRTLFVANVPFFVQVSETRGLCVCVCVQVGYGCMRHGYRNIYF